MINFICAENGSSTGSIIIWVVLIVALLVMLILPTFTQRKRNKQFEQMIEGIRVGDTVRTAGGIIGRVVRITKKGEITTVVLETGSKAEKSYTEFDINFINCVLKSTRTIETEEGKTEEVKEEEEKEEEIKAETTSETKLDGEVSKPETKTAEEEKKPRKPRAKSAVKKTKK